MNRLAIFALTLTLAGAALAADVDRLPADRAAYYHAVMPTAAEQRWRRVPWLTSLGEALKVAAKEGRPVCLWVVDNEPLDRC